MKLRLCILYCLVTFCLLLGACHEKGDTPQEQSFLATVLERNNNSVLVEPLKGEAIRGSSDRLHFSTEGLDEPGAAPGDTVRIVYTGPIQESYPAGIDALSWSLEKKGDSTPIVDRTLLGKTPPTLSVLYGEARKDIAAGTATWSYFDPEKKQVLTITSDAMHPLERRSQLPQLSKCSDTVLSLSFPVPPDSLEVRCWPEAYLERGLEFQSEYEALTVSDGQVTLPSSEDGLVLEVIATWEYEGSTTSYGDASYAFFISSAQ